MSLFSNPQRPINSGALSSPPNDFEVNSDYLSTIHAIFGIPGTVHDKLLTPCDTDLHPNIFHHKRISLKNRRADASLRLVPFISISGNSKLKCHSRLHASAPGSDHTMTASSSFTLRYQKR